MIQVLPYKSYRVWDLYINIAMTLLENKRSLFEAVEYGIKTALIFYESKAWDDVNVYSR